MRYRWTIALALVLGTLQACWLTNAEIASKFEKPEDTATDTGGE